MTIFLRRFLVAVGEARWWVVALVAALHLMISYLGLVAFGESDLTGDAYLYYYLTTVTTVGYGDLSPSTEAGRLFTAIFVMVGGIGVFTAVLGKVVTLISTIWRKRMDGQGDYSKLDGAVVVIGHLGPRTDRLLEELREDVPEGNLVVVTVRENVHLGETRKVRAEALTDLAALKRAGIERASRVIIFTDTDDLALSACLAVEALNESVHIVAYFQDSRIAALAKTHVEALEPVVAREEDLLVRATQDPGASEVLSALVSGTDRRGTLYSAKGSAFAAHGTVDAAQSYLREQHASLLAVKPANGPVELCFTGTDPIAPDATVFYVAKSRLALAEGDA